ncbi:MAG: MATE family efflux transporter [Clostridiales bacterium]|nr:MATE family efflux transporter [Clostridiales bacterium]
MECCSISKKEKINNKQNIINEKTSLLKLTWPIFIETLLAMLIGNIDSVMLSNYSETAVGGVGNANQILGLLTLAFSIIASATGVIVAQYLGAKLLSKMNEIYTVSIFFNLALSGIISIIILLFNKSMFSIMHVPQELLPDALSYMTILGGFIFLQACFNVFSQIFRSNGYTKIGMYISIFINILNIIGNYLFLFGPLSYLNLGVTGVAISSVVSRFIALFIAVYFFYKYIGKISIKYLKPFPIDTLKKLIKIGLPTAGENISYDISQLFIMTFVNTLGVIAVNTKIYSTLLMNFAYLYACSTGLATQIITGHLVGAKNFDGAYKRVLQTLKSAISISILIAIINFLICPYTFKIFTDSSEIIKLGSIILIIDIFLEFGRSVNLVVINSMRAAGDIKFPTYLGMASMWGISVLFSYILGLKLGLGLVGIWIAMAMDEWFRAIIVLIRWKKGTWRNKSIVN